MNNSRTCIYVDDYNHGCYYICSDFTDQDDETISRHSYFIDVATILSVMLSDVPHLTAE